MVLAQALAILKNTGYRFSEDVTISNTGNIKINVNSTHA
jgi:hypothetical protein